MRNKVQLKLLAIGLVLLLMQAGLMYILLNFTGNLEFVLQGPVQTPETAEETMQTSFGVIVLDDASKEYKEYKAEFDKLKADNESEYTLENIYDLDTDYLNTLDMVDTPRIEELNVSAETFCMPADLYEQTMSSDILRDMYVTMDETHQIQEGDVLWLKIFTSMDGQQIKYLDNVYKEYTVGNPDQLPEISGLDEALTGKVVKDTVELRGNAPSGMTIKTKNSDGTETDLDISGKEITFDITVCQVKQVQNDGPTDKNAELAAQGMGVTGVSNLTEYADYILKDYAYSTGFNNLNQVMLQYVKSDGQTKLSNELNKHLNLVIECVQQTSELADTYGPVFSEIQKAIMYEFYSELYEQIPDDYKYDYSDIEDVRAVLNKLGHTEYDDAYIQSFKRNFSTEKEFEQFIKSRSVLMFLVDRIELKPLAVEETDTGVNDFGTSDIDAVSEQTGVSENAEMSEVVEDVVNSEVDSLETGMSSAETEMQAPESQES